MNKKLYTIVILLIITAVGLELSNIHLSSKLASYSVNVGNIQKNIEKLNEENQILNSKVLELTSFDVLTKKAVAMGFIQDHDYVYLLNSDKLTYSQ